MGSSHDVSDGRVGCRAEAVSHAHSMFVTCTRGTRALVNVCTTASKLTSVEALYCEGGGTVAVMVYSRCAPGRVGDPTLSASATDSPAHHPGLPFSTRAFDSSVKGTQRINEWTGQQATTDLMKLCPVGQYTQSQVQQQRTLTNKSFQ